MYYKSHRTIVSTQLGDTTALFNPETCEYLILNDVSSFIWLELESQNTIESIAAKVVDNFDVDYELSLNDVTEWILSAISFNIVYAVD